MGGFRRMQKASSRRRYLASIALAALVSGATVLLMTGGIASGSSSSAQYQYATPTASQPPAVTGTAQVGKTLSTSNGSWTSDSAISKYAYAWDRCDTSGNGCAAISGATAATYTVVAADQGHTLRSVVTATNSSGSTASQSSPTAAVAPTSGGVIAATNVALPNRLIIDQLKYSQNPIRSRTPTTMQVHVDDSNNNSVQGALVYVEGVPYSRIANVPEVATNASGWATLTLTPGMKFPRTGYVTMFVRARIQGQDLLGASSTRRLVQVTIDVPRGS
jgi:hypothetical protein